MLIGSGLVSVNHFLKLLLWYLQLSSIKVLSDDDSDDWHGFRAKTSSTVIVAERNLTIETFFTLK